MSVNQAYRILYLFLQMSLPFTRTGDLQRKITGFIIYNHPFQIITNTFHDPEGVRKRLLGQDNIGIIPNYSSLHRHGSQI
jgi:hypothetical protein